MSTTKFFSIFLSVYLFLGATLLPNGDFSVLPQLPAMYQRCALTHPDMNVFDFVTDHLLDIDGFFDNHPPGDKQRPHEPSPFQKVAHASIPFIVSSVQITLSRKQVLKIPVARCGFAHYEDPCDENFKGNIFHPPIA